jgi:hypothetical protein
MPIMALFRSPRIDQALYDKIIQELDLERQPTPGALTHACAFDQDGICVADVWESRQAFDAFLNDRLRPVFAKLGIEFEPPMVLETYAFNVTDEVDKYKQALATA